MKRIVGVLSLAVAGALSSGCAPHAVGFVPVGTVTVRVAADQEADVVWLVKEEGTGSKVNQTILRCHDTAQGPVCVTAKESGQ